ncbi:P-loop NTPase fold protein [Limibacillus halophilus]|uniref:KAP NTPase domain-containing protein n=1 Tax=Limibacillus halophilus TaxID=1579333 RepID=A0A839SVD4_9PROT|nr:P-loop NTPase fold protein [Limibacillus halophilus]MBB3066432.1 hypothetical protein [Limibacillus halophilus]
MSVKLDPNQHVVDYLRHYVRSPSAPHFAVMLNGPWGIGKTFFVKEFVKSVADEDLRHVYVSLYGLNSFDEIDDAIFRAMYPILENKGVKFAGRAAKTLGKYFRFELGIQPKDFLERANSDLFIFDDLERCAIPRIERILGYINEFVEHEERKVIIIANEREINDCERYQSVREKLIGKTLEIQSTFHQALEAFIGAIENVGAKRFLSSNADVIFEVYNQSELYNLRILQQSLWDFERVYCALHERHKLNETAMIVLMSLLFAFSFELKAGRLTTNDLRGRHFALIASAMRSERDEAASLPISNAQNRYPEIDLGTSVLSDETLVNIFDRGIVSTDEICNDLDASSFFVNVEDEPAWRTVWHSFERTDDEFYSAFERMEKAFAARAFVVPGEILHVLGLRIWLSKIDVIQKPLEDVIAEGKEYIDDLYESGRLEVQEISSIRDSGYAGLGIHQHNTPEYKYLYKHLNDKIQAAAVDRYPAIAEELLDNMIADPELFFSRIALTHEGKNEFYNIPILASADIDRFVSAILEHHPSQQRAILMSLKARYENNKLDGALAEERSWATKVRNELFEEAGNLSDISRYRLRRNLTFALDEVLQLGEHAPQTSEDESSPGGN